MIDDILKDTENRMQKSVDTIHQELAAIRTGRANPAILDSIKVEYYGSLIPLKQIANVATPDPRLLVVQVFDKSAVPAVDKAIKAADLGINPQADGNLVRLPIPPLTEERRRELVKYAHKIAEDGKIAVRNVRRDANDMLKELEKEHEISEDQSHDGMESVQKLTDKFIQEIDELFKKKEQEIMDE
ncbi:MAG TPA: ribosome recycling factor [Candidatus Marinimicrobia bacterium]|mgnify:CR=1 FL=1|nr:ribosome recycling factor [Candidatus Neomarinimicrobiota bacterium]